MAKLCRATPAVVDAVHEKGADNQEVNLTFSSRFGRIRPESKWGKSWRDFEKDGDWNDALYPIGNGIKQAIEKARLR
jgi:hypothetical protein